MANVNNLLDEHVTLRYECLDRIYLNGYVPRLQTPEGLAPFLASQLGEEIPRWKLGRAPRTETTINDACDFGLDRRLANLDALREIGRGIDRRLIGLERDAQRCTPAAATFEALVGPTRPARRMALPPLCITGAQRDGPGADRGSCEGSELPVPPPRDGRHGVGTAVIEALPEVPAQKSICQGEQRQRIGAGRRCVRSLTRRPEELPTTVDGAPPPG